MYGLVGLTNKSKCRCSYGLSYPADTSPYPNILKCSPTPHSGSTSITYHFNNSLPSFLGRQITNPYLSKKHK